MAIVGLEQIAVTRVLGHLDQFLWTAMFVFVMSWLLPRSIHSTESDAAVTNSLGSRAMAVEPAPRGRNPFDASGSNAAPTASPATPAAPTRSWTCSAPASSATGEPSGDRRIGGDSSPTASCGSARRASPAAWARRASSAATASRSGCPTALDWVLAFWGAQLAGAVVVPVNTRFSDAEVAVRRSTTRARVRLRARRALPDGEPVAVDDLGPDDLAAIFYTSGTTGLPEGRDDLARELPGQQRERVRCVALDRDAGTGSTHDLNVPLFHVTGCNSQLLVAHELGGDVDDHRQRRSTSTGSCGRSSEERIDDAHLGAGDLPRAARAIRRSREPDLDRSAGSPTAARRSRRPGARDHGGVPARRGSATASASPRPRR